MGAVTDIRRSKHYPKDFVHYWYITVDGYKVGDVAFLTELSERQLENVAYEYASKAGISESGVRLVRAINQFNYK